MALGSDEAATLEIDVDVQGFDEQMGQVEQRAERAAKAQTAAVNREQKKQAAAVAAGIVAWKKLFDFMEQGTGETASGITRLNTTLAELKVKLATAIGEAPGMSALVSGLNAITESANETTSAVNVLGNALGAMASGPINLLGVAHDLVTGGNRGRLAILQGALSEAEATNAAMREGTVQQRLGARDAAEIMRQINASTPMPNAPPSVTGAAWDARHGGGGGGGGMSAEEKRNLVRAQAERFATEKAERERALVELARIETDAAKDRNAQIDQINREHYAREGDMIRMNADIRQQAEQNAIDRKAEETAVFVEAERQKQEAIQATVAAMIQSTIATIAHGAAEGMNAKQIANRVAVAAAWHALEEAAAGVAALAVTWGVPNPAATGHFVAAGMYGALAVGAAGVGAALPGGRGRGGGGGGGGFASPRGNAMGGGQSGPVNVNVKISAIDLGDRGTLKRVGDVVSAATAAGFVRGRQRG